MSKTEAMYGYDEHLDERPRTVRPTHRKEHSNAKGLRIHRAVLTTC